MRAATAVLLLFCVCRRQGNDVHAFTFSPPPSTAGSATSSSAPAGVRTGGAGLGAGALPSSPHPVFERKHARHATAAGPLRAAAGDDKGGEEGEWRKFGSGSMGKEEEEEFKIGEDGIERAGRQLPEISNPFKAAFDAGQALRLTLADTLGQITGTASPVRRS